MVARQEQLQPGIPSLQAPPGFHPTIYNPEHILAPQNVGKNPPPLLEQATPLPQRLVAYMKANPKSEYRMTHLLQATRRTPDSKITEQTSRVLTANGIEVVKRRIRIPHELFPAVYMAVGEVDLENSKAVKRAMAPTKTVYSLHDVLRETGYKTSSDASRRIREVAARHGVSGEYLDMSEKVFRKVSADVGSPAATHSERGKRGWASRRVREKVKALKDQGVIFQAAQLEERRPFIKILTIGLVSKAGSLGTLSDELALQGISLIEVTDLHEATFIAKDIRPDMLLLGHDMSLEAMQKIRKERPALPAIVIGGDVDRQRLVRFLDGGADDYVSNPVNSDELAARIRRILKKRKESKPLELMESVIRIGPLEVDLEHRLVKREGEEIKLTPTEWNLLQFLARNVGRILIRPEILSHVWGPEYKDAIEFLRVWISRLRKKIEVDSENPQLLKNVLGIGYIFNDGRKEKGREVA